MSLLSSLWQKVAELAGVSRLRFQDVAIFPNTDDDDVDFDFWFTLLEKTDVGSDSE